jgi:hypothetical protein
VIIPDFKLLETVSPIIFAQGTTSKGISLTITGSKSALGLPKPMPNSSHLFSRSVGILVQKFELIRR